jgi:hypothetical protein
MIHIKAAVCRWWSLGELLMENLMPSAAANPNPAKDESPDRFWIIHLDLAREPGHPEGSALDRYTLVLPLGADHRIDRRCCGDFPDLCRVAHSAEDGEILRGLVRLETDGSWTFDYGDAVESAESGFRFSQQIFEPGEYVSIQRNGDEHTYVVVSLQPA